MCPELLGGLDVPRPPAEIQGGDGLSVLRGLARVVNSEGVDVTGAYLDGARTALLIGLQAGCSSAILKEGSPTCGAGAIHDGSFTHTAVAGDGVLAALLRQHGFNVRTEEDGNRTVFQSRKSVSGSRLSGQGLHDGPMLLSSLSMLDPST